MAFNPSASKATGKPIQCDYENSKSSFSASDDSDIEKNRTQILNDEKFDKLKSIAIRQRDQIRELDSQVMELERTIANMQAREEAMALVLKNVAIHCGVDFRGIF